MRRGKSEKWEVERGNGESFQFPVLSIQEEVAFDTSCFLQDTNPSVFNNSLHRVAEFLKASLEGKRGQRRLRILEFGLRNGEGREGDCGFCLPGTGIRNSKCGIRNGLPACGRSAKTGSLGAIGIV